MQQYIKDFLKSRGYGEHFSCEYPNCYQKAVDVHHIKSSSRGKRKHAKDGSDLVGLCRKHHELIHSKNNYDTREWLLDLVGKILGK